MAPTRDRTPRKPALKSVPKTALPSRAAAGAALATARSARAQDVRDAAKRWREALVAQGLVKVELWVPADLKPEAKKLEQALRHRAVITTTPHPSLENAMTMVNEAPWTVQSLKQALDASEAPEVAAMTLTLTPGLDPILCVEMNDFGDLPVYVSVNGMQILASTLLWPVTSEVDAAAFNEFALRSHKLMPLSTFGIVTIDGTDYYELFGALSAHATLQDIVVELVTLAENALDVAAARADALAA